MTLRVETAGHGWVCTTKGEISCHRPDLDAGRVTARLLVRRVPDERKSTVDDQGVLFPIWRCRSCARAIKPRC